MEWCLASQAEEVGQVATAEVVRNFGLSHDAASAPSS
jgi:hypothetical protein